MEAGDLLSEFYTQLFTKLAENPEECDTLSLSVILHDCLCRRYPTEEIEKFTLHLDQGISEKGTLLETVALSYSVKWPLNIVLHSKALEMYNKVFRFLLSVKHSIWALIQIDVKALADTITEQENDQENESVNETATKDETTEEKEYKLHRVILLRSWLLHFIGNIHDYFMTRVLQSTQIDLHSSLMQCQDLDGILDVHNRYISKIYDRCFLHPSASVLKEAVFKVLKSALILHKCCSDHMKNPNRSKKGQEFILNAETLTSLEQNYAKRHQFLATTLHSMTQKRNMLHLEGLAAALLHSFPTVIPSE